MEINIVPVEGNTARKKIRNKSQWKRNVKRRERSATATRKYVPSDLNIKKMWKMYQTNQQDESLKVKECYFRNIFVKHYNIGFKTPGTDVCSKCLELTEKLKAEKNDAAKVQLMTTLRIHKLKAKMFYTYLREHDKNTFTISFDCQKNQVLPKVADQAAYYSRQLYIYNFTVVIGTSTNKFPKEKVRIYTWTENVYGKSSNEIASAVFHLLSNTNLEGKNKIRIMADGCGSQNKNSTMIAMCAFWLTTSAPKEIKIVELIFPVPGHSFMPADRIFGLIEKEIKNKEQIIHPTEYHEIYSKYGIINHLSRDVPVKDWKSFANDTMKPPGQYHFRFAECKRYYLSRVKNKPGRFLMRGEVNYKTDLGVAKSIIKRDVSSISDYDVRDIPPFQVNMSTLKITDVEKLLTKHFGGNWQSNEQLSFNKNILETNSDGGVNVEQSDEPCEHLEEAPAEDRQVTEGQAEGTELKYDRFPPRSEENDYYRSCRGLTEGLAGSSEQVTDGSQPTPRARGERVPSSRARSQNTTQDIRGVCSHDAEHGTKRD
ncbi:unnamed protein product [Diatraea saccharalis]|uniref:DUF7869 domain-containing protein n=1 Tax=Diatraea saccharalis TaxID=40085 RepID=A0A9N9WH72_9NEOP|nr:unnamed protein product [Diatraea saccharalis]